MAEKQFAQGVKVDTIETQYGEIIKLGLNKEYLNNNPDNNGWINIDLKKSKNTGKWYQELNTYRGGG